MSSFTRPMWGDVGWSFWNFRKSASASAGLFSASGICARKSSARSRRCRSFVVVSSCSIVFFDAAGCPRSSSTAAISSSVSSRC
jgi:hypothetical protein